MAYCFKSDNSSLPRGNVERCYDGLGLHSDYLLLAVGCSSKCMDLAIYIFGGLLRDWYLVPQCALDYFDPWKLFAAIVWLV